jgi:hypothetical protein
LVALPRRFGDAGDHAAVGEFAEGDPAEFEATDVAPAAAGELAAVGEASWAGIAREHGEAHVVVSFLQLGAERGVLVDSFLFALLTLDPAGFGHGVRKCSSV